MFWQFWKSVPFLHHPHQRQSMLLDSCAQFWQTTRMHYSWWTQFCWWKPVQLSTCCYSSQLLTIPYLSLQVAGLGDVTMVFVESMCRVKTLSLSGKIMYHFADHFLVQWKQLQVNFPKAIYLGRLVWPWTILQLATFQNCSACCCIVRGR